MLLLLTTLAFACTTGLLAGIAAMTFLSAPVPVLGTFVQLERTENPGVAFGLTLPANLQLIVILCAFVIVCFLAFRTQEKTERIAYGLILGGALSNLLDRLPDGVVTDFVSVRWFSVFNLADTWITVGAILLLLPLARILRRR